jgi:hypothetical protein
MHPSQSIAFRQIRLSGVLLRRYLKDRLPGLIPFAALGQSANVEETLRQASQRAEQVANPQTPLPARSDRRHSPAQAFRHISR